MRIPPYSPNVVEGRFNISPSSIGTFMQNPKVWFERYLLGMSGNKNTALLFGTIIHEAFAQHADGETLTQDDVEAYIADDMMNADVDSDFILNCWKPCADELIKSFTPNIDKVEYKLSLLSEKYKDFSVGGSVDGRYRDGSLLVIYDLKTAAMFKKEIPAGYRLQLMTYALIEKLQAEKPEDIPTHIEIVWIKKPSLGKISDKTGKLIGVKKTEVETLREEITPLMWKEVKSYLKVMFRTVDSYNKDNSLADILFRENKESFIK